MQIRQLLRVARPQFLIVGLALFAFGALWAALLGANALLLRVVFGYLVILPAHLSVSYSNDYFDVEVDRLGAPTPVSGGSGVLVQHPDLRRPALWIASILTATSLVSGLLFWAFYHFSPVYLGWVALGNVLGWIYSAPPLRLAYRGLGEVSTMFTAGFLLPGMGYLVTSGRLDPDGLIFLIPLMLYGLAFILTVEIPDMEVDRLGNKRSWVARWGRGFGFTTAGMALFGATAFIFFFRQLFPGHYRIDFQLLALMSLLPLGPGMFGLLSHPEARAPALRLALANMIGLAVFCVVADGYLVYLLAH